MPVEFGGREAWRVRHSGDIGVAFHWVTAGELQDEPSMVLFPLRKRLGSAAYVLPLNRAYQFAESHGGPGKELLSSALTAAKVMAMDETKSTVYRIATVILDNIEDLVKMPPAPMKRADMSGPTGVMSLKIGGDTVVEAEVPLQEKPQ